MSGLILALLLQVVTPSGPYKPLREPTKTECDLGALIGEHVDPLPTGWLSLDAVLLQTPTGYEIDSLYVVTGAKRMKDQKVEIAPDPKVICWTTACVLNGNCSHLSCDEKKNNKKPELAVTGGTPPYTWKARTFANVAPLCIQARGEAIELVREAWAPRPLRQPEGTSWFTVVTNMLDPCWQQCTGEDCGFPCDLRRIKSSCLTCMAKDKEQAEVRAREQAEREARARAALDAVDAACGVKP